MIAVLESGDTRKTIQRLYTDMSSIGVPIATPYTTDIERGQ